jgi:hypothetical protein
LRCAPDQKTGAPAFSLVYSSRIVFPAIAARMRELLFLRLELVGRNQTHIAERRKFPNLIRERSTFFFGTCVT